MLLRALAALSLGCAASAAAPVLPPWPLEGTVDFAMQLAATVPLARPTGLLRKDYLSTISGVVQFMRGVQDSFGRIIDPYRGEETQYATPCFAFACATVWSQGMDDSLLPNCTSALTAATFELKNHSCADGHCVFFMKPSLFAFRILNASAKVDDATKAGWAANLEEMNPWEDFGFPQNNWGLVGAAGDYLRTTLITNFGNTSWADAMMESQLGAPGVYTQVTPNGLYQDHSGTAGLNPLPYDTFPTSGYLTMLMREGYNGSFAPFLTEFNRRAAYTHLLMQSPKGEIPTGGRSSQHQWNEAVSAMAYEIYASYAHAAGDDAAACQFKRAAHLAAESVARWQNANGALQIVKNHFDPALRWGYEGYSYLTNYNNLPASMLAAAYMYADDSIPECSAPADVGGFVIELPEHHLVIANAAGLYVEIETSPDPNYDPLGLHRIVFDTCGVGAAGSCVSVQPLLSSAAGPPCGLHAEVGSGGAIALGPWWATSADAPGSRTPMSTFAYSNVSGVTLTPQFDVSSTHVAFTLDLLLDGAGVAVSQVYDLAVGAGGAGPTLSVTSSVAPTGPAPVVLTRFGLQLPAFAFDGVTNATAALDAAANSATLSAPSGAGWGEVVFSVAPPAGRALTWTLDQSEHVTRNGVMREIVVETTFGSQAPALTAVVTASSAAPLPVVPFAYPLFKQCDPRWGNDLMVTTTICAVGCLMSSTSMALNGHNIPTNATEAANPGTFNYWLRNDSGYDGGNDFEEDSINTLDPGHVSWSDATGMHRSRDVPFAQVQAMLLRKEPVILNVDNGRHFVLAIGWFAGDLDTLLVNDPGFDRGNYSYARDVVGLRLFNMSDVA